MTPPPIVECDLAVLDAATRREFIAMLTAAGLLAACGDDDSEAPEGQTRSFDHALGTTEVPVDAQRIVALHDLNALLPLLELGIRPVATVGVLGDDGTLAPRFTDGFDVSGIDVVTSVEINLEAVIAARPDLIVISTTQADVFDELSAIAPTVAIDVATQLRVALRQFADLVGRLDAVDEIESDDLRRIAVVRDGLGARIETPSVTVIAPADAGTFTRGDSGQAWAQVFTDLDVLRSRPQQAERDPDAEPLSVEQIGNVDADVVLVQDFDFDGFAEFVAQPLVRNLVAAQAGQLRVVDGTQAFGSAWVRMSVIVELVAAILLEPDLRDDVVVEA